MEILLLALTVGAVIVAVVMGAAAWRLSHEERARSGARVAALAAAASNDSLRELGSATVQPREDAGVVVDPRISGIEPREPIAVNESRPAPWAPARVSTFGAGRPAVKVDSQPRPREAAFSDGFLGGAVSSQPSGDRQRGLAIAATVLFALAIGGGYLTLSGDRATTANAATAVSSASPLELVSLRHERRGPKLEVTGLVRNPAAGVSVTGIAAVVFFFDQSGGFLSSARADIEFKTLAAGDESPFVVALDAPANVARYRVSFRNEAGMLPHVDRRVGGSAGK
ncbi:MAG TPA: hypothetical protein VNJ02_13705 [Vicinamibacterales bacterium]|nr:hypothetical protein [Vicinamibacterales bacterium]